MTQGSFSQESLHKFNELLNLPGSDENLYDFTRCIRPDGSAYGTRGKCQEPNKEQIKPAQGKPASSPTAASPRGNYNTAVNDIVGQMSKNQARGFSAGGGKARLNQAIEGVKKARIPGISDNPELGKYLADKISRQGQAAQVAAEKKMSQADKAAFIQGGGRSSGKSIQETIAQGKKNYGALLEGEKSLYKGGGGDAALARSKDRDIASVQSKGQKEMYNTQVAAYQAGGGLAAYQRGQSPKEIIAQGNRNIDKMDKDRKAAFLKGGGRSSKKTLDQAIAAGKKAGDSMDRVDKAIYKAGGGDAALAKGGSVESIKDKGRSSILKVFDKDSATLKAAGGEEALLRGKSIKELIEQGKRNIRKLPKSDREAFVAGGGLRAGDTDVRLVIARGRRILDAVSYRLGGGKAGVKKLDRAAIERGRKIMKGMSKEDRLNYISGGGNRAIMKGRSLDKVLAAGRKARMKSQVVT